MIWLLALLWLLAMAATALVVFAAAAGPSAPLSRLSRRAMWLGMRGVPVWLQRPKADRYAARGGFGVMALLVGVAIAAAVWPTPSPRTPAPEPAADSAPAPAETVTTLGVQRDRSLDDELKLAIKANIPAAKRVSFMILSGEGSRERLQFADQIRDYLKAAGYDVVSPYRYFLYSGETPQGLAIFPDDKNADAWVMRVGLNDRK